MNDKILAQNDDVNLSTKRPHAKIIMFNDKLCGLVTWPTEYAMNAFHMILLSHYNDENNI